MRRTGRAGNFTEPHAKGNQDITVAISLPMREAALLNVLRLFQIGNLNAAVTIRQES